MRAFSLMGDVEYSLTCINNGDMTINLARLFEQNAPCVQREEEQRSKL